MGDYVRLYKDSLDAIIYETEIATRLNVSIKWTNLTPDEAKELIEKISVYSKNNMYFFADGSALAYNPEKIAKHNAKVKKHNAKVKKSIWRGWGD